MSRKQPQLLAGVWRVSIAEHTVGGRYRIPAVVFDQHEAHRRNAIIAAVRASHVRARDRGPVPAWRPFLRESVAHCSVERVTIDLQAAAVEAQAKIHGGENA